MASDETARRDDGFDLRAFLATAGAERRLVRFRTDQSIYRQGEPADRVFYVERGRVKLSVVSTGGRTAVVTVLGPRDFLGEDALTGASQRLANATALEASTLISIDSAVMRRLLHDRAQLSDRFIAHLLARNAQVESDLVSQLFNSSERRLARALLMLARYGAPDGAYRVVPRVSQEVLAEIVGTTRSRVNVFMNKFRRLGFIHYNGDFRIDPALLSVVLRD